MRLSVHLEPYSWWGVGQAATHRGLPSTLLNPLGPHRLNSPQAAAGVSGAHPLCLRPQSHKERNDCRGSC